MKIFNKYMLLLAAAPMLWSCSDEMGENPGSDPDPVVTIYTYEPTEEGSNPDNDVRIRFATNSKVTSVKYLLIPGDSLAMSDAEITQMVESQGTTVANLGADGNAEVTVSGIKGAVNIAAVANGSKLSNLVKFTGLEWTLVKPGTFAFGPQTPSTVPVSATECTLEICTTDTLLYRLNSIFGEGTSLKLEVIDTWYKDEFGDFQLFRFKQTKTPWEYGNYGLMSVRDVGYWQNNAAYVNALTSYCNYLYTDGYIDICMQWNVPAGNCGYGYSSFTPSE